MADESQKEDEAVGVCCYCAQNFGEQDEVSCLKFTLDANQLCDHC